MAWPGSQFDHLTSNLGTYYALVFRLQAERTLTGNEVQRMLLRHRMNWR
jgi:hypothetical protein